MTSDPNNFSRSWLEQASRMLTVDEGSVSTPYRDSLGFWTVGVGHYIGKELHKLQLSDRVIQSMLEEDIAIAWDGAVNIFGAELIASWSMARQHAILNLVFNLGETKFRQFRRTIAAIRSNDWVAAGDFLLDSLWAKQVKKRSERVVFMVKTGLFHDSYRPTV